MTKQPKTPPELDRIVDRVLAYRPKPVTTKAKKRKGKRRNMDVDEYRQKVINLFNSGTATEAQWEEMSHAVLYASEDNSDEATPEIDKTIFPGEERFDHLPR